MAICLETIRQCSKILDHDEVKEIIRLASDQDVLELIWQKKMRSFFNKVTNEVLQSLETTGQLPRDLAFADFFTDHALHIMKYAIENSKNPPQSALRMRKPPPGKTPTSLAALMKMWDQWRKTGKVPPRQRTIAQGLQSAYLKKVQSVWNQYSMAFRTGSVFNQKEVRNRIKKAAQTEYARAQMIVETETTYYYNKTRRNIYDKSKDVTHYLYIAVRDMRTTNWCKSRQGLVYAKTDPLCEKETPPIHWNCRSEMLPLTPQNPRHKALIDNPSLRRRNHSPEPLPKGWTSR